MSHTGIRLTEREGLHAWLADLPGRWLLDAEIERVNSILPDLFGYHILQVGVLGRVNLLARSRVLHRTVLQVDGKVSEAGYPSIVASPDALPVASDSIDVLVLPHILEYAPRVHDALREAERVLLPEGHLLILGFNPWSLFGLWRLVLGRRRGAPWKGQFFALSRLRDWLALLGFDVVTTDGYFFRPPFGSESVMRRLAPLEKAGRRLWPYFAGAYLVVAKKRVTTLTPLRPRWRPRRHLVPVGVTEPSARVSGRA